MGNVALVIERLREELESLITLEGLNHQKVLKLSQKLDEYILLYYLKKM
ncbi:MAG TPA: aspartyl-phosphate phosphatase Spo0E family protein [Clostridium sp.]